MEENEPNSLTLGARFGEYQIVGILGRGAFGEVYKVLKLSPEVPRALKILHESYSNLLEIVVALYPDAAVRVRAHDATVLGRENHGSVVAP